MTLSKTALSLLGAAALAVSLTACGGDDDDTTASSNGDNSSDDGGDGGDAGAYCERLEEMGTSFMAAPDPDSAPDLAGEFRSIAEVAPGDIKADWESYADVMEALGNVDYEDPDSLSALEDLDDLEGALERITQHIESECA
ncbi:hypothetical protein [Phytoactinopolyspora limicola]|uniref:hypothetical protein n=1 Tax=Phytoactinopolyspora limicola TaxID=2715536 RepID=UPI0014091EF4|nr:hypothetical protein [Phytoactinopolyspora limicola]